MSHTERTQRLPRVALSALLVPTGLALALLAAPASAQPAAPTFAPQEGTPPQDGKGQGGDEQKKQDEKKQQQGGDAKKKDAEKKVQTSGQKGGEKKVGEQKVGEKKVGQQGHGPDDGHGHGPGDGHGHDHGELKGMDPELANIPPSPGARLTYEFGTESKKFGQVMQGDVLQHTFELESSGTDAVIIKQAKPTCGCTVADILVEGEDGKMAVYQFGEPIPQGRKIEITATLSTQNKRGKASSRINIFSNDPRGQTQLGLEADVTPFFTKTPDHLNFNQISVKDVEEGKVTIQTTGGQKVLLSVANATSPPGVTTTLTPIDPDEEGRAGRWELHAKVGPGLNEGNLAYAVPIVSDVEIPGAKELPNGEKQRYQDSVTVMARVMGMISYEPPFISLGLIRPGQVMSRPVTVTSNDPSVQLGEPTVTIEGRTGEEWEYAQYFSHVVRPVMGENKLEIEVRLDGMPETLNGSFSGILKIDVGHEGTDPIKLPITGVCRSRVHRPDK